MHSTNSNAPDPLDTLYAIPTKIKAITDCLTDIYFDVKDFFSIPTSPTGRFSNFLPPHFAFGNRYIWSARSARSTSSSETRVSKRTLPNVSFCPKKHPIKANSRKNFTPPPDGTRERPDWSGGRLAHRRASAPRPRERLISPCPNGEAFRPRRGQIK